MKVLLVALLAMLLTFSAASPLVEAEEVIEGILVGAFGDVGHKVKECIQDGELIFEDIKDAIVLFESAIKTGSKQDLERALIYVGDALSRIPEEIKDCEEVPELVKDIEKIAAEFLNPEELIIVIGEKILWHGFSILHDVEGTVSHFENAQYEPAGEDIGDIIKIIFLSFKTDPAHEAISFLQGFFKGSLEDGSVELETCLSDADNIVNDIQKTIHDIETDPLAHLEELFMDLVDLLADIPTSVQQCQISTEELQTFAQWANELKNVEEMAVRFYKAFLKFPAELKTDFETAIDAFKTEDFNSSGFSIGDILNVLFVKVSLKNPADDAITFTKSFFKAAFKIDLNLDECKAAVEDPFEKIIDAVKKMASGSIEDIKTAIAELMVAIPALINSFSTCEQAWPQIEAGLEQLKTFVDHPASIIIAVSEAVAMDPISFPRDAYHIYDAFTSTPVNYQEGGEASGDITMMVLKYMPHDLAALIKESN
jgi:hypothetical protein